MNINNNNDLFYLNIKMNIWNTINLLVKKINNKYQ